MSWKCLEEDPVLAEGPGKVLEFVNQTFKIYKFNNMVSLQVTF